MTQLTSGWVETTIADVCEYISRGKSPKYAASSSLPVVNQKAIRWHGIENEYLKYIAEEQRNEWSAERFIQNGDILWNSTGTGTVGRACLVRDTDTKPPKVVDTHVTIVRPNKRLVVPRYLFWWIRGPAVQEIIGGLATGTTNQVELSRATIRSVRLPLPPLAEQKRIADKLDRLLAAVDTCKARLDAIPNILKRFRQSVLAAAVSGELTEEWRASRASPMEWQTKRFGDLVVNHDNKRVPVKLEDRKQRRGAYPYYGAFGIIDYIDDFRYDGTYLLVAEDGKNLESRDRPITSTATGKFWVNNHAHVVQARDGVELAYLQVCIESPILDLSSFLTGIDQVKLTRRAMDGIPIGLPPVDEQGEIIRRVEHMLSIAERVAARVNETRARVEKLTGGLLAKAFCGELVSQRVVPQTISGIPSGDQCAVSEGQQSSEALRSDRRMSA